VQRFEIMLLGWFSTAKRRCNATRSCRGESR
jgi:hypothetical protein